MYKGISIVSQVIYISYSTYLWYVTLEHHRHSHFLLISRFDSRDMGFLFTFFGENFYSLKTSFLNFVGMSKQRITSLASRISKHSYVWSLVSQVTTVFILATEDEGELEDL